LFFFFSGGFVQPVSSNIQGLPLSFGSHITRDSEPDRFHADGIGKRGISGDVAAEVRANNGGRDKLVLAGTIAKNIVLNPVVLMTALGIIGNLVFKHNLPVSIAGVLNVSTFSGCDSKLQNSYWRHDNVCPSKASFNLSISPVLYQSRVDHWIGD